MIDRYIIYFFILSFVGYIYECIVMTIWIGKWDNRGFLFGPVIPIYGFGALFGTILFQYLYTDYTPMSVFVIGMVASAILEYTVHYAMEKLFNAYWWDYSKAPLNINGRICLPATVGFGIAALIIVYGINPHLMPVLMGMDDTLADVLAIVLVIIFTIDWTLTVSILSSFTNRVEAMDSFINEHMENIVGTVLDESDALNYRFYNVFDKLEERRKTLISDRIEKTVSSMSDIYRTSLSKIRGFRGKNAGRMNYMLSRVKNRVLRKKKQDE